MNHSKISNNVFEENLSHTEFRVLMYLIYRYDYERRYANPTRATIESDCNISKNTLGRALKSLEHKGCITRAKSIDSRGWNNIYYIKDSLIVK